MIRVLIADDRELMRGGLRAMLDAHDDIEVVGEAADGGEAVDRAIELRPDVVIIDIRMPRVDGIEATRRLAAQRAGGTGIPRVLVLTTFDLDEYVWEALRAGAGGFLLKDAPVKTHVTRILSKLDLRDRVQIVVLAYESGLVQPGEAG